MLAVISQRAAGRIYNVAEPQALSYEEWTRKIAAVAGWDGEIVLLPKERLPAHLVADYNWDQDWVVDTTRIREELGYTEVVPLEEALRRTIEWWRVAPPEAINPRLGDPISEDAYKAEDAVLAELARANRKDWRELCNASARRCRERKRERTST